MKKINCLSILAAMCLALTACANGGNAADAGSGSSVQPESSGNGTSANGSVSDVQETSSENGSASAEETQSAEQTAETLYTVEKSSLSLDSGNMFTTRDYEIGYSDCTVIELSDGGINVSGRGASVSGDTVAITEAGSYLIKGTLSDGQIVVDADGEKVQIVLENASVTSKGSAALYVKNADKVFVTTADSTVNMLASAGEYVNTDENNVDGAVFSKSDITLNGSGKLTVTSETAHGIVCKDDLKITGGEYVIDSAKKGIDCNESVRIANGDIRITGGTDGIHAENDDEAEKAFVYIGGGTISITSGGDAIDASGDIAAADGTVNIVSDGGAANAPAHSGDLGGMRWDRDLNSAAASGTSDSTSSDSAKGIKSDGIITIGGGTFVIDSSDDALHAAGAVNITGGIVTASSGDDGIHSDTGVQISGGSVKIMQSYEGIEGEVIEISGGAVYVRASDDGMNASGGQTSNSGWGMETDANAYLIISGGDVNVNADGDGLDSNGYLLVKGGTTYVSGPTNSGNGALDYGISGTITGGTVIAAGASGMAENFGNDSTQGSILYTFDGIQAAGTEVSVSDSSGNVLASFAPEKQYQCALISAPGITAGGTYTVSAGESSRKVEMTSNIYGAGSGMGSFGGRGGMGEKENGGFGGKDGGAFGGRGGRNNTDSIAADSSTQSGQTQSDQSQSGQTPSDNTPSVQSQTDQTRSDQDQTPKTPDSTGSEQNNDGKRNGGENSGNGNENNAPEVTDRAADGERPEMQNGERPEFPQDGQMPEFPQDGQMPGFPQDGQMPGFPQDGQMPEFPQDGQMPEFPQDGQMPGFSQNGGFGDFGGQNGAMAPQGTQA